MAKTKKPGEIEPQPKIPELEPIKTPEEPHVPVTTPEIKPEEEPEIVPEEEPELPKESPDEIQPGEIRPGSH